MRGDSHAKGILPPLLFSSSLALIPPFPTPSALVHTIFFFVSVCPPPLSLDPPLLLSFLISTRKKGEIGQRDPDPVFIFSRRRSPPPPNGTPSSSPYVQMYILPPFSAGKEAAAASWFPSFLLSFFLQSSDGGGGGSGTKAALSLFLRRTKRTLQHTHMQAGNSQRRKYRMDLNRTMRKCG